MPRSQVTRLLLAMIALAGLVGWMYAQPQTPQKPPVGPFGLSRISTPEGAPASIDLFIPSEICGVCHERQWKELQGSMHLASHSEPLYRSFAELARKEAGDEVYAYCSGCHSPAGVVSRLIPKKHDPELPAEAKAGVSCEVCHQITSLTGREGPWGEPGNASFVLHPGRVKYASSGSFEPNRSHSGEKRDFFAKSEFCASCHTVIHPHNGLRIENTYGEWKESIYAAKGIQCQDCHMRSVDEAKKVAETLQPIVVKGLRVVDGVEREIHRHYFVGGNANADRLADGKTHAAMAEARLKSAARIELKTPAAYTPGQKLELEVIVQNVAAGHNLPTGVTELRQMWVDLRILNQNGKTLFRSGALDEKGDLAPDAIWFGATAVDKSGKDTFRPWEMAQLARKRTIPPKEASRDAIAAILPADLSGPITLEAKLLYRSAAPGVVALVMQEKAFAPKIIEMAKTTTTVAAKAKP
jgi:hypothetical protein